MSKESLVDIMKDAIEKSQAGQGRIHPKAKKEVKYTTRMYYDISQFGIQIWAEKHALTDFKEVNMDNPYTRKKMEKLFSVPITEKVTTVGDGLIKLTAPISWPDFN